MSSPPRSLPYRAQHREEAQRRHARALRYGVRGEADHPGERERERKRDRPADINNDVCCIDGQVGSTHVSTFGHHGAANHGKQRGKVWGAAAAAAVALDDSAPSLVSTTALLSACAAQSTLSTSTLWTRRVHTSASAASKSWASKSSRCVTFPSTHHDRRHQRPPPLPV